MKPMKPFEFTVTEKGCHQVTSHKPFKNGYIPRRIEGKTEYAHRLVYTEHHGEIPEGLIVRHKCDNRACINPEHLEVGTHHDNLMDKIERGRQLRGADIGNSKLTEEIARKIKYDHPDLSESKVARLYDVTPSHVHYIRRGKRWGHI